MPTLVVQLGLRSTTFTYYSSLDKVKTYYLNFAYSHSVNRSSFDEVLYYEALVKQMCSQNKIPLEKTDIYFINSDHCFISKYKCKDITELLNVGFDSDVVYVDGTMVAAGQDIHSSCDINFLNYFSNKNDKLNKDLYALTCNNEDMLNEINDNFLKKVFYSGELKLKPLNLYKNVVFTGPRFYKRPELNPADMRFILDTCSWGESITLQMDSENSLLSNLLLKSINPGVFESAIEKNPYRSLGTLLNTNGPAEVLVISDEGTNQLFDLDTNELFLIPLGVTERVKVKLKSKGLPMKEFLVSGGSYGVIFDSRDKRGTEYLQQDRNDSFWLSQRLELSESLNRL